MSPSLYRPTRRPERLLILGSCLTVFVIVAIVTALLIREHANTLQTAKRTANNITQLIDADVLRNVELYDLALQGLIAATQRKDLSKVSADIRHLVQFERSAAAPFKGEVLLLDAKGAVVADSSTLKPTPRNFADRDYFIAHKNAGQTDLFISRPFRVQCNCEQVWRIAFSRRVSGPDGRFQGVAVASMLWASEVTASNSISAMIWLPVNSVVMASARRLGTGAHIGTRRGALAPGDFAGHTHRVARAIDVNGRA